MNKRVVTITGQSLTNMLDNILETFPYSYQQAFANTELRDELIAYVLSRCPYIYLQQSWPIESVINEGIYHILCKNGINRDTP
jgi:hypothetical protein